ncbi:hypothetical protein TGAMA5MH_05178 [Trichoderma gamsii]|uniref:Uncharacterized protein n=1 Tax=Trichoderma gamsii TaxID=398673 RepID=A0A2K0TA93_9HYPO|nr:hypothetical protein TGAMA5MH_05178 [Trichoderma gamsii]
MILELDAPESAYYRHRPMPCYTTVSERPSWATPVQIIGTSGNQDVGIRKSGKLEVGSLK